MRQVWPNMTWKSLASATESSVHNDNYACLFVFFFLLVSLILFRSGCPVQLGVTASRPFLLQPEPAAASPSTSKAAPLVRSRTLALSFITLTGVARAH